MKPMTEAQAWASIGRAWTRPTLFDGKYWAVVKEAEKVFRVFAGGHGICPCINDLVMVGAISERRAGQMKGRLPERREGLFCWPTTRAGARARAAFCRRMAKLASKESK